MSNPLTPEEMVFLKALAIEGGLDPDKPATAAALAVGITYLDWYPMALVWRNNRGPEEFIKEEYLEPSYRIPNPPPCPWGNRDHYIRRSCEALAVSDISEDELRVCIMKLTRDVTSIRVAQPHGDPCPNQTINPSKHPASVKVLDWAWEWIDPKDKQAVFRGEKSTDCPVCHMQVHLTPGAVVGPAKSGVKPVKRSYLHLLRCTNGHPEQLLNDSQFAQYQNYWSPEEIREATVIWNAEQEKSQS